ncbi:hypothetical protein MTO96_021247 [Rhipicephalus appendiculatus]
MSRGSPSPHHSPVARRVGVVRAAAQVHESRECLNEGDQPGASVLGPITHSPVQSHQRLHRQGTRSPSVRHQRSDEAQRGTVIQFVAFIEATASHGDNQLQLSTMPSNRTKRHFPCQQERSVTVRDEHYKASNIMLHVPELSGHPAKAPAATVPERRCVQDLAHCDILQPAISCEILGARTLKGRHWLPSAVPDARSPFVQRKSCRIRITVAGNVGHIGSIETPASRMWSSFSVWTLQQLESLRRQQLLLLFLQHAGSEDPYCWPMMFSHTRCISTPRRRKF